VEAIPKCIVSNLARVDADIEWGNDIIGVGVDCDLEAVNHLSRPGLVLVLLLVLVLVLALALGANGAGDHVRSGNVAQ